MQLSENKAVLLQHYLLEKDQDLTYYLLIDGMMLLCLHH